MIAGQGKDLRSFPFFIQGPIHNSLFQVTPLNFPISHQALPQILRCLPFFNSTHALAHYNHHPKLLFPSAGR